MKLGEKQDLFIRLLPRLIDKAHGNGLGTTGTNNGSTAHESARVVRV